MNVVVRHIAIVALGERSVVPIPVAVAVRVPMARGFMHSKLAGPGARSHRRMAVVGRVEHRSIRTSHVLMMKLLVGGLPVALVESIALLDGLMRPDSTGSAVVAHTSDIVDHCGVIDVVYIDDVHVGHCAVVKELSATPVAAMESHAGIAEAVVDAAIESDMRSPVALVPHVITVIPAPITGSPEDADNRRLHPGSRDPVIAIGTVRPVAGRPDVSRPGTNRLHIHRQRRRADSYGNTYRNLGSRRNRRHRDENEQRQKVQKSCGTHREHRPK